MADRQEMGRLAMRQEGDWWVGYYALPDTMDDAIDLGRLHMRFASDPVKKDIFLTLMQDAVADLIEELVGERPGWSGVRNAPEHERAGRS